MYSQATIKSHDAFLLPDKAETLDDIGGLYNEYNFSERQSLCFELEHVSSG